MEWDRSDIALQQQHGQEQATAAADAEARGGAFKQNMGTSPDKGDVIETEAGRFIVLNMSMDGIQVKQLGAGGRTINVPHGTKFQAMGQAASGKTVFKVVK